MKTTSDRFEQLELGTNDLDMIVGGAVVFGHVPVPQSGVYVSWARRPLGDGGSATMPHGAGGLHVGMQANHAFGMPLAEVPAIQSRVERAFSGGAAYTMENPPNVGQPSTPGLVAHELAHVVQQTSSGLCTRETGHEGCGPVHQSNPVDNPCKGGREDNCPESQAEPAGSCADGGHGDEGHGNDSGGGDFGG